MRILYIDCDSLRPDHLGCYGYERDTSPNIDQIASEGFRFEEYYASDVPCLPSRTALFSGRFGIHTGVVDHGGPNAEPRPLGSERGFRRPEAFASWPKALSNEGIHTCMISPFPARHDAWHVLEGIDEFYDTGRNGNETADEIFPYADRWLAEHAAEDDWFCHVNFWDPHKPYTTPADYPNPFADDPAPEWLTEEIVADQRESYGPHGAREPHGRGADFGDRWDLDRMPAEVASRADFERWIDAYDTGIKYMDDHVGRLFDRLESQGVLEETVIVVSADHGENLGELNVYGDHQTADYATSRVPLLLSGPGVDRGVDDAFRYQVDLPPTVIELAGGRPPERWDGRSFRGRLEGKSDPGREELILTQGAWACQRSVRWDRWLLVRTYDAGLKAALDEVMLFDVETDPHETTNLAERESAVVESGLARLERWHDDRMTEAATGTRGATPGARSLTDPLWEVLREDGPHHVRGRREAYVDHLRETGRAEDAAVLEARFD